jgi:type I restriction enzyme S subunit
MSAVEALSGRLDATGVRPWKEVRKGYTRFQEGDVLFAKITPCMENGKAAIARGLTSRMGAGSTEFHVMRPGGALRPELLLHYVLQEEFRKTARSRMTGTAGQLRVPSRFLEEQTIPIPPFPEQRRIVEAIESYFTRLDDAVATLERVQRNLKRYRASVLKAAVEGRLVPTEAELARAEGRDYEPASVLLERILTERRRRWEEVELGRMKAHGNTPKDEQWRAKYKEPVSPNTTGMLELPEGWTWATVDQLAHDVRYGSSAKADHDLTSGVPVLRMGNIADGAISFADLKYLPADHPEFPDLLLEPGDLLFNRTNSAELVGKTAVFRGHAGPCSLASYLIRVRVFPSVEAQYVALFINSFAGRSWIASVVSQQVGQANVNGSKLKDCVIPLPPEQEQIRIVHESDHQLSLISQLRVELQSSELRCFRLRQSMLKWAFEGRLVDQDPSDEPASRLLERIATERQGANDNAETPQPRRRKESIA